jgi:hypothetical protein
MPLPNVPARTGTVNIAGTDVTIRALSRLEVLKVGGMENIEAEPFVLAAATGVTLEEATAWLSTVDAETGGKVALAILELSAAVDPRAPSTGEGPIETP